MNATFIGDKPDRQVTEVFVYLAKGPDGEGLMAAESNILGKPTMMPMISTNEGTIRGFAPLAKQMAKAQGIEFGIYRFRDKTDVTAQFCELPKQDSCERALDLFALESASLPPLAAEFLKVYTATNGLSGVSVHRGLSIYAQCAEGLPCADERCLARADDRAWFAERKQ